MNHQLRGIYVYALKYQGQFRFDVREVYTNVYKVSVRMLSQTQPSLTPHREYLLAPEGIIDIDELQYGDTICT
jgi:hypothetical protein